MNGPGWVAGTDAILTPTNAATLTTTSAITIRFAQWYIDTSNVNLAFAGSITLMAVPNVAGAFQYSCDNNGCDTAGYTDGVLPLDGRGWVATNPILRALVFIGGLSLRSGLDVTYTRCR